ncbi:MAG: MFS transporter [Candidatus Thorarchaeota archaeon]|nr:MFS transporter [Candidatus Thorarchaeota archaeon]
MENEKITEQGNEVSDKSKVVALSALTALSRLSNSFRQIVLFLFVIFLFSGTGINTDAFYGLIVAVAGYVQAFTLFPAGTLSDKRGRGIAIFIGGLISGIGLILMPFAYDTMTILILYALTGIGSGFTMTSIKTLVADYTERGEERTRSYGITMAAGTLAAIVGPLLAGYILDPIALPGVNPEMLRYTIVFFMWGGLRIVTGVIGFFTAKWLQKHVPNKIVPEEFEEKDESSNSSDARNDTITSTLFGISRLIMGFSSGMVVPYLIPWIAATFNPSEVVLGSLPAISNVTLATGALFVGLASERVGKVKMITSLYILAPILTIGLVYTPFLLMAVFYIARMAVANMATPAFDSLFMGEVSQIRRGRSLALTRVMWTFPRQTGTLLTSILLGIGFLGTTTQFGIIVFPIAMALYPISVIPMYIAVRRNQKLNTHGD